MRRPVFLSFCYRDDVVRMQQIVHMGVVEGQQILNPNDFEEVKRKGKESIEKWIDEQMKNKQCLIVLIGEHTAERPFVRYEIEKAYAKKMPMFGIYIHNLKDLNGNCSKKGKNPFEEILGPNKGYKCKDPDCHILGGLTAYKEIENNIGRWIEEAIKENELRKIFKAF